MFVTFEGPEGAGKSSVIRGVAEALRTQGVEVLETREPGSGEVGKAVRELLLHGDELSPLTELFLFLADRAHHIETTVIPALQRGAVVLCDRHADSTVVYQGHAGGLDVSLLRDLNRMATRDLRPDLTLLLDLPPEVGLARLTAKDRLDSQPLEFHQKVRAGFLHEAEREPARWVLIDASAPLESVLAEALSAIRQRLRLCRASL